MQLNENVEARERPEKSNAKENETKEISLTKCDGFNGIDAIAKGQNILRLPIKIVFIFITSM